MTPDEIQEARQRSAIKRIFALWAADIRQNGHGFCHKIPDKLLDKVPEGQEHLVVPCLKRLNLREDRPGLWRRREIGEE